MEKPDITVKQERAIEQILSAKNYVVITVQERKDGEYIQFPIYDDIIVAHGLLKYAKIIVNNKMEEFASDDDDEDDDDQEEENDDE